MSDGTREVIIPQATTFEDKAPMHLRTFPIEVTWALAAADFHETNSPPPKLSFCGFCDYLLL
jgi:hypothetical protein